MSDTSKPNSLHLKVLPRLQKHETIQPPHLEKNRFGRGKQLECRHLRTNLRNQLSGEFVLVQLRRRARPGARFGR